MELTSEPESSAADLVDAIYANFQRIHRPRIQRTLNRVRLRDEMRECEEIWAKVHEHGLGSFFLATCVVRKWALASLILATPVRFLEF